MKPDFTQEVFDCRKPDPMFPQPEVFLIAETQVRKHSVASMLESIGNKDWKTNPEEPDAASHLTEIAGRLCYKSFGTGLNSNITKTREGNREYVQNIIKQQHGSVLEHSTVTFGLINVSRILTHELVRHRAGCAYSQESQRYMRLDSVSVYKPNIEEALNALYDHHDSKDLDLPPKDEWIQVILECYDDSLVDACVAAEAAVQKLISMAALDNEDVSFHIKKELTSAFRRFAPAGTSTNIIFTANHRALRHLIETRTALGAEIEIRDVFFTIANMLVHNNPSIYADLIIDAETKVCTFKHSKV